MIGLIDYGVGNIGSLGNALRRLDIPFQLSGEPGQLESCERLLLPGVGAFKPAMNRLKESGLDSFIQDWAGADRPLLGICLGMQLLFSSSEERGSHKGLGILPGKVIRFRHAPRRVHMGWNNVEPVRENPVMAAQGGYGYFVHSYHCVAEKSETVAARSEYREPFTAAVWDGKIWGVQFHPEKSDKFGVDILRRFAHAAL